MGKIGIGDRLNTNRKKKYYFCKGLQKGTLRPAYIDSVRA